MIYLFGMQIKTVLWALIGFFLLLILSMCIWPQRWRQFFSRDKKQKPGSKPKGKSIIMAVIIILSIIIGLVLGSVFEFKYLATNMPQPILASSCAKYNECTVFDCSKIMSAQCASCVCSYCGGMDIEGAIRIDIPYSP